jgi:uncharacterized membrane protein YeaQ/YmgE (transglycosylase-associated protein family)
MSWALWVSTDARATPPAPKTVHESCDAADPVQCLEPQRASRVNAHRNGELSMENDAAIGWIAAIIIGGIAGWLAEQFMKSNMGVLMNIVLGIVGAIVANALLSVFGIALGGWIGYLIAGFIGACILIAIARMFRPGPTVVR